MVACRSRHACGPTSRPSTPTTCTFADGPGVHVGMPSTTLTFVLPLGEPLDVSWADDPDSRSDARGPRSPASTPPRCHPPRRSPARHPAGAHDSRRARPLRGAGARAGGRAARPRPTSTRPWLTFPPACRGARRGPGRRWSARALAHGPGRDTTCPAARAEVGRALALLTRGVAGGRGRRRGRLQPARLSTLVRDEVGVTPAGAPPARPVRAQPRPDASSHGRRAAALHRRRGRRVRLRRPRAPDPRVGGARGLHARPPGSARSSRSFKPVDDGGRARVEHPPDPKEVTMTDASTVKLWHTLSVQDADAMIAWLSAIGFTEHATYRDEVDPTVVAPRRVALAGGGGLMFGTQRPESGLSGHRAGRLLPRHRRPATPSSTRPSRPVRTVERADGRPGLRRSWGSVRTRRATTGRSGSYQPVLGGTTAHQAAGCATRTEKQKHGSFHTSIQALEALDAYAECRRRGSTSRRGASRGPRVLPASTGSIGPIAPERSPSVAALGSRPFPSGTSTCSVVLSTSPRPMHRAMTASRAAIDVLHRARRKDGRWPTYAAHPGRHSFELEPPGPSRWNTSASRAALWWRAASAASRRWVRRGNKGNQGRDPARRGHPRAHARPGGRDGDRRDDGQRPDRRRLHLRHLHRDQRPGQRVPRLCRPPARLRRRAPDLRPRARDRGLHAALRADAGARRDRPAARRHHPRLPPRRRQPAPRPDQDPRRPRR